MTTIDGANIVLAVTGGVAAYKAADLASKLVQAGANVHVIMTESATRFVGQATFEALTGNAVHGDIFEPWRGDWHGHISLGRDADLLVVAPATANAIAKLAHGLADDMLGAVALTATAPLMIAPAMEHTMFHHPATQANLRTLQDRRAMLVGPESGRHASGGAGDGRMSSPELLLSAARFALGRGGPLAGRRFVISAGGTREALDPVRYLGNRSSGRMGYALAESAIEAGADVTLVSTVDLPAPYGCRFVAVESADEMLQAVGRESLGADVLIMAAAVADFRPSAARASKIKKQPGQETLTLELVRNPDVLASINHPGLLKVGFAAETEDLVLNARDKLARKGLAMIVANDAVQTIGSAASSAQLVFADGSVIDIPHAAKSVVASNVISHVISLLGQSRQ